MNDGRIAILAQNPINFDDGRKEGDPALPFHYAADEAAGRRKAEREGGRKGVFRYSPMSINSTRAGDEEKSTCGRRVRVGSGRGGRWGERNIEGEERFHFLTDQDGL